MEKNRKLALFARKALAPVKTNVYLYRKDTITKRIGIMPLSKTSLFTEKQNQVATLAKALAHPARIAILTELSDRNSCICGEIVEHVPLAQATVSQHLKELKQAGLVKGEVEGPRICYCVDLEGVQRLHRELGRFIEELEQKAAAVCC